MTTALEGGEWSAAFPGRTLPPEKTRYPLYRRLGGPQGRSGQMRKISPPPGFGDCYISLRIKRRHLGQFSVRTKWNPLWFDQTSGRAVSNHPCLGGERFRHEHRLYSLKFFRTFPPEPVLDFWIGQKHFLPLSGFNSRTVHPTT
jgi:hypothetical protein